MHELPMPLCLVFVKPAIIPPTLYLGIRRFDMKKKISAGGSGKKGTWLTYRPDIKVLDCTIRDGGLVNNSQFTDEFVRAVFQALADSGVDYMEVGYKGDRKIYSPSEHGCWRHC